MKSKTFIIVFLVGLMVSLRFILLDFANFAPMAAIGIFSVFYLKSKWKALGITLGGLLLSDLILQMQTGNALYASRIWDYVAIAAVIVLASIILKSKNKSWPRLGLTVLSGSLVFFFLSNFGVWAGGTMYSMDIEGLLTCYKMGIPFYRGTLLGDVLFTGLFVGIYELVLSVYPSLKSA